jgi:16S rRNA (uracil1498-N3)-methyltransferase
MHHRFYAPALVSGASHVDLPREEAEHLSRVMRLKAGAAVRVFDGRGREVEGRVERVGRSSVSVTLLSEVPPVAEPRVSVVLGQAVLKGDAMDQVVRDAVMLGVARIVPLATCRTEVRVDRLVSSHRIERWQRIAVASAKQCGRAVVPDVGAPLDLAACLRADGARQRYLLAEPALLTSRPAALRRLASAPPPDSALLLVGPEGGWTPEEVRCALAEGCEAITLGPRTLRADAAAVIALAALHGAWGELDS